ncbi:MAG: thioredoxin family protein [Fimbriimonadaceae bacterium]
MTALIAFLYIADQNSGPAWQTNYSEAVKEAKATNKPMLVNFTGSDWCGWCIRLKKEVFTKRDFRKWAAENVVLVELDYPQQTPQSDAIKKQNKALAEKYRIESFPTILFINGKEEVIGQSGYLRDPGPKAWTKYADSMIASWRQMEKAQAENNQS